MSKRTLNHQRWLNDHGARIEEDGDWGRITRAWTIEVFRNQHAPAITDDDLEGLAARLGCTVRQIKAVAKVESAGVGWDDAGLLKCLWERHYLWRRVKAWAKWTAARQAWLSNPDPGGYTIDADKDGVNDSWEKLADAAGLFGFDVAAECASFGKFQIMGAHWKALGYASVREFVWLLSLAEIEHYEAFARFIQKNGLLDALRRIDGNPANCLAFAVGYNGKGQKGYDSRIAAAWRVGR